MTSVHFSLWLQGYLEIAKPKTINEEQLECIQRHLSLVFKHEIDPSMPNPELDEIHAGKKAKKAKELQDMFDSQIAGQGGLIRC